jgi:hypothetical protein
MPKHNINFFLSTLADTSNYTAIETGKENN